GWDVVRLCGHPKRAFRPLAQLAGNNSLVQFSRIPIGRAGYLVSRRGAQKLLKPRKVCRPGDVEMTHPWNLDDLDTYGVVPPPVRQERKKLPSTIGARRGDISRWQRAIPDPRRTIFSIRKLGLLWWLRCCCHNVLGRHVVSTAQ
ncbi:MAG TPA: hypothetical protein VFZ16_12050, partial [Hyphomicrobiaceae bacterium]|nr:hypothetical protein [Hyphomicrobiaceae bacterium]